MFDFERSGASSFREKNYATFKILRWLKIKDI